MSYRQTVVRGPSAGEDRGVSRPPRILALVLRIRDRIDEVFARYVGPISAELGREEFEKWCTEGDVGPRALHRYIARLARYIPQPVQREAFIKEAAEQILQTR